MIDWYITEGDLGKGGSLALEKIGQELIYGLE
jgi:hypothetical protein